MYLFIIILVLLAIILLSLKYRVIIGGERYQVPIKDIKTRNMGYSTKGMSVKKHSYMVIIEDTEYYTSHGCLFPSLGKRKIGKLITVYRNIKYGKEVVQRSDVRVEITSLILLLTALLLYFYQLS